MPAYRFAIATPAAQIEHLGYLQMQNDGEAIAFADALVDDLRQYANISGWAIMVTEGARAVGRLALEDSLVASPLVGDVTERSAVERFDSDHRRTFQGADG